MRIDFSCMVIEGFPFRDTVGLFGLEDRLLIPRLGLCCSHLIYSRLRLYHHHWQADLDVCWLLPVSPKLSFRLFLLQANLTRSSETSILSHATS